MPIGTIVVEILAYSFSLWLGAYLIARNPTKARLYLTGLGLVAYALALAVDAVRGVVLDPLATGNLSRLHWLLVFAPALAWSGALVHLLPEDHSRRTKLIHFWVHDLLPINILVLLIMAGTNLVVDFQGLHPGPFYPLFSALVILPLLGGWILVYVSRFSQGSKRTRGMLLAATLFFTLGAGLLLYPLALLPRLWVLLAIGFDLLLLGWAVAALDAFDQGEALLPDISRSLSASALAALVFGGQVVLVMYLGTGVRSSMIALLLGTIAVAILWQTFSDPLQTALDRLAFAASPHLRNARARLRTTGSALPKINEALSLDSVDEEDFARLTRRALSDYNDLPRLISNPLTRLPLIEARLKRRGAADETLERANELKAVLAESIKRLKPREKGDFGTTDEWRYYNALHFPYVVGLKPYSRRADQDELSESERQALEWFQTQVPERTLYNWQTAAAKLVAQDLREQVLAVTGSNFH